MHKIAVVTGGAGGIGRAVAERLGQEQYTLILLDLNKESGDQVAHALRKRELQVSFLYADLTQEVEVRAAFDSIIAAQDRIDLLVNVAGGSLHRNLVEDFSLSHWRAVIDANLTSTFLCCRAVIGLMKTQNTGAIVNVSSDIAVSGDPGRSAYAAAKAAILGLTRSLALESAPFGIRVNAVAPGRIATPRVRANYSDAEWEAAAKRIPLGHPGKAEDVAEVVTFLASEAAKHVTGQTIHVNGGRIVT